MVLPHSRLTSRDFFLPKGDRDNDADCVVRKGEDTRALGLKNKDNRIVIAAANYTIRHSLNARLCFAQRGFVVLRQSTENVLELDAMARVFGVSSLKARCPLLAF